MDATVGSVIKPVKKNRGTDIAFRLRVKAGMLPKTSVGTSDSRLLTGDNRIHAILDHQSGLWYMQYDNGVLPPAFKQKFTSLHFLTNFIKAYYDKRNIDIEEIMD